MHYRNIATLNAQIADWCARLPQDIEVVAGIPRSGLLAATLLALHRNLPSTDVNGLIEGRVLCTGRRLGIDDPGSVLSTPRSVLVLDDTVGSGWEMRRVKARIAASNLPHTVRYASVYVTPEAKDEVDFHCEILPRPQWFEWNVMHTKVLELSCLDIDGVLCRDPSPEEDDDGPRYRRFLENAEPLHLPTRPVGWLVTCRLQKYRALTERWLARHGVAYRHLVMMNYPDAEARRAAGAYARFKAHVYRNCAAELFLESCPLQASGVAELSRKPVLCTQTQQIYGPRRAARRAPRRAPGAARACYRGGWGAAAPQATVWQNGSMPKGPGAWARKAAFQEGKQFGLTCSDSSPAWFLIPRWVFRKWLGAAVRFLLTRVSSDRQRRNAASDEFFFLWGTAAGFRGAREPAQVRTRSR